MAEIDFWEEILKKNIEIKFDEFIINHTYLVKLFPNARLIDNGEGNGKYAIFIGFVLEGNKDFHIDSGDLCEIHFSYKCFERQIIRFIKQKPTASERILIKFKRTRTSMNILDLKIE